LKTFITIVAFALSATAWGDDFFSFDECETVRHQAARDVNFDVEKAIGRMASNEATQQGQRVAADDSNVRKSLACYQTTIMDGLYGRVIRNQEASWNDWDKWQIRKKLYDLCRRAKGETQRTGDLYWRSTLDEMRKINPDESEACEANMLVEHYLKRETPPQVQFVPMPMPFGCINTPLTGGGSVTDCM
jgi:hypothetical protein